MKHLPLLLAHYTGQHAMLGPWLLTVIEHALQPIARAWHLTHEETTSEPPFLSCSGSCTSMYKIIEYTPGHNQFALAQ